MPCTAECKVAGDSDSHYNRLKVFIEFPLILLMTVNSFLMKLFCRQEINSTAIQTAIKTDSAGVDLALCS